MRKSPTQSSTATKATIAITGLAIIAFLIIHLAGNLLFFAGKGTFNSYSHILGDNPVIPIIEIGLLAVFLVHVYKTVSNFAGNRAARPERYHMKKMAGYTSRKSVASSTMIVTGLITLAFVVLHLAQFKFGSATIEPNTHVRDLFALEQANFANPFMALFYAISMGVIGFHLWHGTWSALQSLGLLNTRFMPKVVLAGKIFACLIAGGFLIIPVLVFFGVYPH